MYSENFKKLRFELKLSAQKLADSLGVHKMTISNYENGNRKPTYEVLEALYNIYNINLNWFVSGQGNMFITENKQPEQDIAKLVSDLIDAKLKDKGIL